MEKKYPIEPEFIDFIKAERNAISKEMLNDEWWLCIPLAKRVVVENILIAYDQMVSIIANAAPAGTVWVKASDNVRATIEDIILSAGKHNQEQCSEIADAILRELPSFSEERARWVKASERLPNKDGIYCIKWCGLYYSGTFHFGLKSFTIEGKGIKPALKVTEWLDEIGTESPGDAVNDFLNWLYENGITRLSNGHWYKWDNGHGKEVYYADGIDHIRELFKQSK